MNLHTSKFSAFALVFGLVITGCHGALDTSEVPSPAASSTSSSSSSSSGAASSSSSSSSSGSASSSSSGSSGNTSSSSSGSSGSSGSSSGSSGSSSSGSASSGSGNPGSCVAQPGTQAMCAHYQRLAGVTLGETWTKWWAPTEDSGLMNLAGNLPDTYLTVAVFNHCTLVEFLPVSTKDEKTYFPFDTCDYPGSYCAGQGNNCVASVGHFWWTVGNCDVVGPVLWDSNNPQASWKDNPDGKGDCTSNGTMIVP